MTARIINKTPATTSRFRPIGLCSNARQRLPIDIIIYPSRWGGCGQWRLRSQVGAAQINFCIARRRVGKDMVATVLTLVDPGCPSCGYSAHIAVETSGDLAGCETVGCIDVAQALSYRRQALRN